MTRHASAFLAAALWFAAAATHAAAHAAAEPPAFDCAKASREIEILVCDHSGLAALDRELAEVYDQALSALEGTADEKQAVRSLKAYQRGWVKGRDDCWKAEDKRRCTEEAYTRRIAELRARYALVPGGEPKFYVCNGNPADEIVATFYATDPSSVRLERGDRQVIAVQARSASGVRYLADFGVVFWEHHGEALVEWPQGTRFTCAPR